MRAPKKDGTDPAVGRSRPRHRALPAPQPQISRIRSRTKLQPQPQPSRNRTKLQPQPAVLGQTRVRTPRYTRSHPTDWQHHHGTRPDTAPPDARPHPTRRTRRRPWRQRAQPRTHPRARPSCALGERLVEPRTLLRVRRLALRPGGRVRIGRDRARLHLEHRWNRRVGHGLSLLTVVAAQLAGTEQAGMFSMAFAVGTLLMFLAVARAPSRPPTSTRRVRLPPTKSTAGSPRCSPCWWGCFTVRCATTAPPCSRFPWASTSTKSSTAWPMSTRGACSRPTSSIWPASARRCVRSP